MKYVVALVHGSEAQEVSASRVFKTLEEVQEVLLNIPEVYSEDVYVLPQALASLDSRVDEARKSLRKIYREAVGEAEYLKLSIEHRDGPYFLQIIALPGAPNYSRCLSFKTDKQRKTYKKAIDEWAKQYMTRLFPECLTEEYPEEAKKEMIQRAEISENVD